MHEYWIPIERRLTELGCLEEMALLPGATSDEIAALEQHIGCTLPDALKQSLSVHNGQKGFGLYWGQGLLSVAAVRQQWDSWRAIDETEMNLDCADFMRSEPVGFIKPMYCNPAWIPLTYDGGGNHIGLDFDPDKLGKSGQIIAFGRDEDTKRLIAGNFEELLTACISWLERAEWNGEYLDSPNAI